MQAQNLDVARPALRASGLHTSSSVAIISSQLGSACMRVCTARRSWPISMQACAAEAFAMLCTLPTTPALLDAVSVLGSLGVQWHCRLLHLGCRWVAVGVAAGLCGWHLMGVRICSMDASMEAQGHQWPQPTQRRASSRCPLRVWGVVKAQGCGPAMSHACIWVARCSQPPFHLSPCAWRVLICCPFKHMCEKQLSKLYPAVPAVRVNLFCSLLCYCGTAPLLSPWLLRNSASEAPAPVCCAWPQVRSMQREPLRLDPCGDDWHTGSSDVSCSNMGRMRTLCTNTATHCVVYVPRVASSSFCKYLLREKRKWLWSAKTKENNAPGDHS